jgi:metal-sulfur cluster biosynthetic enzyme
MADSIQEQVKGALRWVIDPELGINIVDMGLVYDIEVRGDAVQVSMTMTSPVCPMGAYLVSEAEATIRRLVPEVRSVAVELVWDPPWEPSRIAVAARRQLGLER